MEQEKLLYKRILLKLSGENFGAEDGYIFDHKIFLDLAEQVKTLAEMKVEVAIVVGGGNIFRGASYRKHTMDSVSMDQIGMLATLMNGIFFQNVMENIGLKTRLMSSIEVPAIAESYIRRRAVRHLEKGRIVIFGAGTGNPFFTTDTAAVLRGREINADIIVKCSNVDGIYDKDPKKHLDARKFDTLHFAEALHQNLNVMDSTAFSFSKDHSLEVYVLDIRKPKVLIDFILGKAAGTLVTA